jgi:hypothetical protein
MELEQVRLEIIQILIYEFKDLLRKSVVSLALNNWLFL